MSNINDPETVCVHCLVRDQSIRSLSSDLAALQDAAQRLVDSLPRCSTTDCERPVERAWIESGYCQEHGAAAKLDYAAPLRALLRCLGEKTK